MLNRRILRAKTMQSVFGALQVRNATLELATDSIAKHFSKDLHLEQAQKKTAIREAKIQQALLAFDAVAALKGTDPFYELPDSLDLFAKDQVGIAILRLQDFSKLEIVRTRRELEAALQVDEFDHEGEAALLKQAQDLFLQLADESTTFAVPERTSPRVRNAAIEALNYLQKNFARDIQQARRDLINECEELYVHYLTFLRLLIDVSKFATQDEEERQARLIKPTPQEQYQLKIATNPIILKIEESIAFQEACIRQGVTSFDLSVIRPLFAETVMPDQEYQQYSHAFSDETDFEAHKAFVRYLATKLILKAEVIDGWFEDRDLYWAENREILKSMVVKTIKTITGPDAEVTLSTLSADWEDDKDFTMKLYDHTMAEYPAYFKLLGAQSDNWDASRFSHTDLVIMVMCLAEIMNFSQVPVRVSINEYLEIAKQYSTPQSHPFINALIDGLVQSLQAEGKIKKTGRGLILQ